MNRTLCRASAGALALAAVTPTMAAAHPGHAGDHGFLYAALQPLLGLDHFLAGVIVAAGGAVVLAVAARVIRTSRRTSRP